MNANSHYYNKPQNYVDSRHFAPLNIATELLRRALPYLEPLAETDEAATQLVAEIKDALLRE